MPLKFDFLLSQWNRTCVHHPSREGAARPSSAKFHRLGAGAGTGARAAGRYLCRSQHGLVCQAPSCTVHRSPAAPGAQRNERWAVQKDARHWTYRRGKPGACFSEVFVCIKHHHLNVCRNKVQNTEKGSEITTPA